MGVFRYYPQETTYISMRNGWCCLPSCPRNPNVDSFAKRTNYLPPRRHRRNKDIAVREDLIGIPGPTLHRLMALRNALVALKGPLANDPALCESVHKRLFEDKGVEPFNEAYTGIEREPLV